LTGHFIEESIGSQDKEFISFRVNHSVSDLRWSSKNTSGFERMKLLISVIPSD
jgi:hypothetical protein